MLPRLALCALLLPFVFAAHAQGTRSLAVAPDSPRWELQGKAEPAEYHGRKSLLLDGGAAVLKDLEMRDGVIDVDVATPASRGFFGIQFRIADDGANAEWVYLRQHKSGLPDAHAVHAGAQHRAQLADLQRARASPAPSISRRTSGFTCASR